MREVVAFGAITVKVFALVICLGYGYIEPRSCLLDIFRDFGQVGKF
jgi:hypothetical protein